jgi:hypothetical protein
MMCSVVSLLVTSTWFTAFAGLFPRWTPQPILALLLCGAGFVSLLRVQVSVLIYVDLD